MSRGIALLVTAVACLARAEGSEPGPGPAPEPPPEAGDGDYTLEAADTLGDDELVFSVAALGGGGAGVRRSQRVSFRGGGARGTLRDGDDVLAGGRLEAPFAGGAITLGRLAPRWGRGLVLGGAADPWMRQADDRGEGTTFRGHSGDGVAIGWTHGSWLAGRFRHDAFAGAQCVAGPGTLGVVAGRRGPQISAGWNARAHAGELAIDTRGRWRAEAALTGVAGETRLALRVRGGLGAFRSFAEPARAGPARAVSASATRAWGERHAAAFGSLWRWGAGQDGARGALEVGTRLGHHASFAAGIEQQHGARREPTPRTRATEPRQGLWCEWRGGSPVARLTLRHELWGARAFAREAVRRAVVARAEFDAAHGSRIGVTHAVWLVRRGENLYLPEPGPDRLVLRAASGAGSRTRVELLLPLASGDIRLGLTLLTGGTRGAPPPAWSVEWSRRSHVAQGKRRTTDDSK